VTITPNNDWQPIRDYLQSQKGMVTPPATNKKKRLSKKNNVDETYKRKKRNKRVPVVEVVSEELSNINTTPNEVLSIPASTISNEMDIESATSNKRSPSSWMIEYVESVKGTVMRNKIFTNLKRRRQIFVQGVMTEGIK
jgi:hypothetical protein